MNKLVINTSSSLYFTKIGLLPRLLKYFQLMTTEEVKSEVNEGQDIGYKDARIIKEYISEMKIRVEKVKGTNMIIREFGMRATDASVIALAKEASAFLATEDQQMEKVCLITQTKITNTALLVYYLWKKKEFDNEHALLLLDLLIRSGYNKEICLDMKERIV